MTRDQKLAVAGLLAAGVGAFAAGKRKADRQDADDEDDGFVEVPIRG
ncbi:ORF 7 [Haloarcula hispanica virus SH1]|uniref:ORF 7 n=1 Tax=Haloarcula hispanica SH1 virus TaxID=326574 RepID=Q4KPI0_9VIRU|nr:ORF 7 [Haloarcula hispanica virus SH1]AAY24933.1 ORF 7 [Haloarcula hispanica virus SH1]